MSSSWRSSAYERTAGTQQLAERPADVGAGDQPAMRSFEQSVEASIRPFERSRGQADLRCGGQFARDDGVNDSAESTADARAHARVGTEGGVAILDRGCELLVDRAGIQSRVHAVDRGPDLTVA